MNLSIYNDKKAVIANDEGDNMEGIISEINHEDIQALIGREKLVKTIGNFDITKSEYDGWRIIYRKDGEIIGSIQGVIMPDKIKVLSNIYVKPEYRRQGYGTKLKKFAFEYFKDLVFSGEFTNTGAKFFKVNQSESFNFEHNQSHHPEGNPFYHTLASLRTYKGDDSLVNLSILFHDVGKGESYQDVPGEEFKTFHGHDKAAEDIIKRIANRMK